MRLAHCNMHLTPEDKLDAIRHLDPTGTWESLDEWRYCTVCKKLFSARQIEVLGGARPLGPLRLHCPTAECDSTPADWRSSTAYQRAAQGHINLAADSGNGVYRDDGR